MSKPVEEGAATSTMNSFLAGFTLQFLNLKAILYGISVFSIFIVPSYQDPLVVSLFAPLLAGTSLVATSSQAVGSNLFRTVLNRHYCLFNLAMGQLLIYSAIPSLV